MCCDNSRAPNNNRKIDDNFDNALQWLTQCIWLILSTSNGVVQAAATVAIVRIRYFRPKIQSKCGSAAYKLFLQIQFQSTDESN